MAKPPRGSTQWRLVHGVARQWLTKPSPRERTIKEQKIRVPRRLFKPPHRRHAKGFSFIRKDSWNYAEAMKPRLVINRMIPFYDLHPHLVLRDWSGIPRFTLRYDEQPDRIVKIRSIQRERTKPAYIRVGEEFAWSPKVETQQSNEFRARLGMHPSEFLMSEFIFLHRKEIRKGLRVLFILARLDKNVGIYKPILDRFFRKVVITEVDNRNQVYELNINRRRVKELLEIP